MAIINTGAHMQNKAESNTHTSIIYLFGSILAMLSVALTVSAMGKQLVPWYAGIAFIFAIVGLNLRDLKLKRSGNATHDVFHLWMLALELSTVILAGAALIVR